MPSFPPPLLYASRCPVPTLLSVPHSGTDYPPDILALSTQGVAALQMLEDPLVDRLAWRAVAAGVGAVVQRVPRAIIDCNRGEGETDPSVIVGVSPHPVGEKAKFGLGIVPSRTRRHGRLWRRAIDRSAFEERLRDIHRPYHEAIANRLDDLCARYGSAILLDLHSMPPRPSGGAQIVIGDRFGTTASGWLADYAARQLRDAGLTVARNEPYAGGEIVARHGRPHAGVHALQIEIDRRLYLDQDLMTAGPGFDAIAQMIERLALTLGEALLDEDISRAAE